MQGKSITGPMGSLSGSDQFRRRELPGHQSFSVKEDFREFSMWSRPSPCNFMPWHGEGLAAGKW